MSKYDPYTFAPIPLFDIRHSKQGFQYNLLFYRSLNVLRCRSDGPAGDELYRGEGLSRIRPTMGYVVDPLDDSAYDRASIPVDVCDRRTAIREKGAAVSANQRNILGYPEAAISQELKSTEKKRGIINDQGRRRRH